MITYKLRPNGRIWVYLDGKSVGSIQKLAGEYRYQPWGGLPGEWFPTLAECKRSLEPQSDTDRS